MPEPTARPYTLQDLAGALPDEASAITYFTKVRWRNGEYCPHCGHPKLYHFSDGKVFKCADCKKRFSITAGTLFKGSKVPLRSWMVAIWYLTDNEGPITSTGLSKLLGVTQATAWQMLQDLSEAAQTDWFNRSLRGKKDRTATAKTHSANHLSLLPPPESDDWPIPTVVWSKETSLVLDNDPRCEATKVVAEKLSWLRPAQRNAERSATNGELHSRIMLDSEKSAPLGMPNSDANFSLHSGDDQKTQRTPQI